MRIRLIACLVLGFIIVCFTPTMAADTYIVPGVTAVTDTVGGATWIVPGGSAFIEEVRQLPQVIIIMH